MIIDKNLVRASLLLLLTTIASAAMSQTSQVLPPQAFEKKMAERTNHILLDVRTQAEYQQGHLANATHLDFYRSDFKTQLNKLDKNKPVFVYCAVGGRSGSTSSMLANLGFKEVYDLSGGIQNWVDSRKPVVK